MDDKQTGESSEMEDRAVRITPDRYTSKKTSLFTGLAAKVTKGVVPNAAKEVVVPSSCELEDEVECELEDEEGCWSKGTSLPSVIGFTSTSAMYARADVLFRSVKPLS